MDTKTRGYSATVEGDNCRGYSATVDGDRVEIYAAGQWAGTGTLRDGRIEDCAAVLGNDQDESDEAYAALEAAIRKAGRVLGESANERASVGNVR